MTNLELLAEDILRMKHRDKILQVLSLFLAPRDSSTEAEKERAQE